MYGVEDATVVVVFAALRIVVVEAEEWFREVR